MPSNIENAAPKNLGVYIHIPYCKAKCAYCSFVSVPRLDTQRAYVDRLTEEIRGSKDAGRAVDTVYIGGGTPSCLYRGGISHILSAVRAAFDVAQNAEITVEANPESCDDVFAAECAAVGVNRISIGLQSSNDEVLRGIGRLHSCADFIASANRLKKYGFDNISSDIILGLPGQTAADIDNAIDIMAEHCTHASVYALSVEDGTPLKSRGYAPDDDFVADLYERAVSRLAAYGFERYEVSNFARSGRQSRHNKKYWSCEPYLGFGAAAHGYDGEYVRYANSDDICEYLRGEGALRAVLTDTDRYNEYIMLRLRTTDGIDKEAFRARFGYAFEEENAETLKGALSAGLVVDDGKRIAIAPNKMFVMNGIIEEFMKDAQ